MEQHQHRRLGIAPHMPDHRSVAARRFHLATQRAPAGRDTARPLPIQSFIGFPSARFHEIVRMPRRHRQGQQDQAHDHDDRLRRRHPPAMAAGRTRPGVRWKHCRAPPSCWATSSANGRWTNWRRRCWIAASTCTGSSATTTTTAARRCGPTWSSLSATRAPPRCAARQGRGDRWRAHRRSRRDVSSTHLGTARTAARASTRQLPDDLASLNWAGATTLAALIHSLGATAIWPEDYEYLATQRADVLVTHEAPRSHPAGNAALDALARAMGVKLIVHGHHHTPYRAVAPDGLRAMGVGAAWGSHHRRRPVVARRDAAAPWQADRWLVA